MKLGCFRALFLGAYISISIVPLCFMKDAEGLLKPNPRVTHTRCKHFNSHLCPIARMAIDFGRSCLFLVLSCVSCGPICGHPGFLYWPAVNHWCFFFALCKFYAKLGKQLMRQAISLMSV